MQKGYSLCRTVAAVFLLLCILFIPLPFYLFPFQESITDVVFGGVIDKVARLFFSIQLTNTKVYSDSTSMYLLVFVLAFLSLLAGILLNTIGRWKQYENRILQFFSLLFCYYLILMLMKYGLDKIFKAQFYLPEPNILYTRLGQIDKDFLYWTSMGTSRLYNIITGSVEVLAALLILFKRTRMTGLLLAVASLVQVVAINFGFDISVKLYSLFLLSLSLYLLAPYYRRIYTFLFTQRDLPAIRTDITRFIKNPFWAIFLKCFITGIILFESLYPYIRHRNFNDDVAGRPYLHGAYEVRQMIAGADTLLAKDSPIQRFFIHRDNFLIFQNQADEMQDYKLTYDKERHCWILTDYQQRQIQLAFNYQAADSLLTLRYLKDSTTFQLMGKMLDWKKLPLIRKTFHWTVDGKW
ncbi:MAG: hypothetical protein IPO68_13545 [Chitinophagaceae bacterium]|nr:hypothetical protein [Chitinophagaceae bacterium]